MSRFHLSWECSMQMSPSGDFFMTAVDSQRCSRDRDPVTPIRRPNLLSDSPHIGSIIQRAHQSYREMASAVIEGEMFKLCVCVCVYVRQTLFFPPLLFFMLRLPFLPLNLLLSTSALVLPSFILSVIPFFTQVHSFFTHHIALHLPIDPETICPL